MVGAPVAARGGMLLAMGGAASFSINDMAVKFLSGDYPLHQVTLVRAVIGIGFLLVAAALGGGGWRQLRTRRPGRQALRMLVVLAANACFFLGLAAMPLADAVALAFIAPVLITVLSALFLRERIGPHRMTAVLLGLAGTMVLMRPGGASLQSAGLLILFSALCYATSQLLVRSMRETESAIGLTFYAQLGFLLGSVAMGLAFGDGRLAGTGNASLDFLLRAWVWPQPADWPFFIATGVAIALGSTMVTQAYRLLEAGAVAPFEYVSIPMAILWGALIFGTLPDALGLLGMAMVVAAGLYILWRESRG